MNDKKPLVSSEDYGKDEDSAETLIKKHEVIEKDIIGLFVCVFLYLHACNLVTNLIHTSCSCFHE